MPEIINGSQWQTWQLKYVHFLLYTWNNIKKLVAIVEREKQKTFAYINIIKLLLNCIKTNQFIYIRGKHINWNIMFKVIHATFKMFK